MSAPLGTTGMVDRAQNRGRILTLILLATLNYCVAAVIAATITGVAIVVWVIAKVGDLPSTGQGFKYLGLGSAAVIVGAAVVGGVIAVVRIPSLRAQLERQVLTESGAVTVTSNTASSSVDASTPALDAHSVHQVQNLLDGLAIAAGLPAPKFAVVTDPAPNSFGVGTKPDRTVIGITTGLITVLTRDELEAILAYEITRVASWDVAMSTWTAALTGRALTAVDHEAAGIFGAPSRWFGLKLQAWALRGQGAARDEAAISMSRNPASLIRALEKLAADPNDVAAITPTTAPLWVEVPASLLNAGSGQALGPLLLDERIDRLRALAHLS